MKRSAVTLLLASLAACGQPAHGPHASHDEAAHLGGEVVARVAGRAVTVADVDAELRAHGGTPHQALDRVIAAQLLAQEAARRGYGDHDDVVDTTDRVAVQVLLARQVEDQIPERSITDADVAAAYDAAGTRFRTPEQRGSAHVLVQLPRSAPQARSDAARALAERARLELVAATDVDAVLARWSAMQGGAFAIRAEHVPATASDGDFAPEYLATLFAIDATHLPRVAAAVVRTQFGWHAIVLTDVVPGRATPLASVAAELRGELLTRRRRARLDALLAGLVQRTPPIASEDAVRRILAGAP